ncbi:MAG: sensor histidine kinase [Minwuia sp.]|uniref:sensor histidine kinase n=1 Tax=Minwuia sp. TaxID=2493630 RepID=UPI003A85A9EA
MDIRDRELDEARSRLRPDPAIIRFKRGLVERYGEMRASVFTTAVITVVSFAVSLVVYEIIGLDYVNHPVAIVMPIVLPILTAFPTTYIIHRLAAGVIEREAVNEIQRRRLAELATEAERQKEAAETASRAKSSLLANMSHELRTPLNAIIGFSDIFQGDNVDRLSREQLHQYAADINISGRHLLALVNDLLELARIERGSREFTTEAVSLPEKIEEVVRIMRTQADEAGVRLLTDDEAGSLTAMTDDRALRQMLLNLVSNAVKFTPEGGEVRITAGVKDGNAYVRVADTGIGIPESDLDSIFEPFSQVDNSLTRRKTGSGLGLALVRTMIEQQGGRVTVVSQENSGSTFTLYFAGSEAPDLDLAAE